jgi:hypothetical protein
VIDSTPSQRFFQNSSTESAPGKRPVMPMMATADEAALNRGAAYLALRGLSFGGLRSYRVKRDFGSQIRRAARLASERMVACSKTSRLGSLTEKPLIRLSRIVASSEVPPTSKKLSSMLISGRPSRFFQISRLVARSWIRRPRRLDELGAAGSSIELELALPSNPYREDPFSCRISTEIYRCAEGSDVHP